MIPKPGDLGPASLFVRAGVWPNVRLEVARMERGAPFTCLTICGPGERHLHYTGCAADRLPPTAADSEEAFLRWLGVA